MKHLLYLSHPRGPVIIHRRAYIRFARWSEGRGWPINETEVEEREDMFIDGGGMVSMKEPVISAEIHGAKFSTFLRHAPFVVEVLRTKKANHIPKVVTFGGGFGWYAIAEPTVLPLADEFDMQYINRQDEIHKIEKQLADVIRGAGGFSAAPCSCLSGKPFVECHGRKQ